MRTIGFPELLVILGVLTLMLVPVVIVLVILGVVKRKPGAVGSIVCGNCGQRIPDIGTFCPFCGQKFIA